MDKKNWLCKIRLNGRIFFSDYLTSYEAVRLITGVDILDAITSDRDGKQHITILNKYFEINLIEL